MIVAVHFSATAPRRGRPRDDECVEVVLDLAGHTAAPAEDPQLDVLVVGSSGHVRAGEEHVAAVDDDGLAWSLAPGGSRCSVGQW